MEDKKSCLIAEDGQLSPEFHRQLLLVCRHLRFLAEQVGDGSTLMKLLSGPDRHKYALILVDIEMLRQLPERQQIHFKGLANLGGILLIGLEQMKEEETKDSWYYNIHHCLLRKYTPAQVLCMLRSAKFAIQRKHVRRQPRYLVQLPGVMKQDDSESEIVVMNLSVGGAFIKNEKELPPGTILSLTIDLCDSGRRPLVIPACEVIHNGKMNLGDAAFDVTGMGVKFLDLKADARDQIRWFLRQMGVFLLPIDRQSKEQH